MYIGITDTNWLNFIKEKRNNIGKYINFWTPGTRKFRAIEPGEMFLFKLHAKKAKGENGEIVGGAYFDRFDQMSVSDAWNSFGYGNGVASYDELKFIIDEYRTRNNMNVSSEIGCIILKDPFFFDKDNWIESPDDWSNSIVSGKKYDTSEQIGANLYHKVIDLINYTNDESVISNIEDETKQLVGKEREELIKIRVNQCVFRDRLLKKYNCCCLCKVGNPDLLVASHIKPWSCSNNYEKLDVNNGLLLCPNHDALFDAGFISFNDNGSIMISKYLGQVDAVYMNVNNDMRIDLSSKNKKYLEYHRKNIFRK